MSKRFTNAPKPRQPTDDDIAAFERGGVGHDNHAAPGDAHGSAKAAPAEPTKRLSLDIPASKHMRFKTACSATGRKMVAEIEAFIERRISELEAEAGITRN